MDDDIYGDTYPCPIPGCEVFVCADPWDSCHDHDHELTKELPTAKLVPTGEAPPRSEN